MGKEQFLKNLTVPTAPVDVVLDTDAYNEVDDQFAIAYLLASSDRCNTKAIYAARVVMGSGAPFIQAPCMGFA